MATLYTSPQTLKRDTALGTSVDEDLLRPYIRIAQDRWILPALGTKLDEHLKSHIDAGTLIGNNLILVRDYIQPSLVQLAFCEVAFVVRLRFSNNSVTVADSEQGASAQASDIKLVTDRAQQIGLFYRERLMDYLCDNTALFPSYNQNTGSDLSPNRDNYFGGINIYPNAIPDRRLQAIAAAIGASSVD
jgi:hypothetical protein